MFKLLDDGLVGRVGDSWAVWRRRSWLALALSGIGAGAIGVVLPLIPTTPFLLLAAWAAPKASPRLDYWLHSHRHSGPPLRAWRDEGAVPPAAKIAAAVMFILSWSLLCWLEVAAAALWATGCLFVGVMAFLLSRPSPQRN